MIRWGIFGLLTGILMAQAPEPKVTRPALTATNYTPAR